MITVDLEKQRIGIGFFYSKKKNLLHQRRARTTTCVIFDANNRDRIISVATVTTWVGDSFIKAQGRKQALRRALYYTIFDKEDRETIWNAYHDRGFDDSWKLVDKVIAGEDRMKAIAEGGTAHEHGTGHAAESPKLINSTMDDGYGHAV